MHSLIHCLCLTLFITLLGSSYSMVTPEVASTCQKAYRRCKFSFEGSRRQVPTYTIGGPADQPFTDGIISSNRSETIGLVQSSNRVTEFVTGPRVRDATPITDFGTQQPLQASTFRTYQFNNGQNSAIGHQYFQSGQLDDARNRCVRHFISFYQIISDGDVGNTVTNVNNQEECIVFLTE